MDSNDEFGKWLKHFFFTLPFLACYEVNEAFSDIICPNDAARYLFTDYILNNCVEDECLFSPKLWAENPSMNPR